MGHECVELRNTAAAVQCYRKYVCSSYMPAVTHLLTTFLPCFLSFLSFIPSFRNSSLRPFQPFRLPFSIQHDLPCHFFHLPLSSCLILPKLASTHFYTQKNLCAISHIITSCHSDTYLFSFSLRAVDVSSGGDYRAWYGLGQTYEV
jgi:hypothetical protein